MNFQLLNIFRSENLNTEIIKKFCFFNNVRSKYFTVIILLLSVILSSYDILILQKIANFKFFLVNFKADIVLLVSSIIFTVYIYFNQVKSYKEIRKQHKFIHGIISLFILCWSALKSIMYNTVSTDNLYFFIGFILLFSVLYLLPKNIFLFQSAFTISFFIACSFMFNLKLDYVFKNLVFIVLFYVLAFIVSRYIYHLQYQIILKDKELEKYK